MSADPITQMAALGLEPTYSAREAAALLKRSYSWLDQRLRREEFMQPDGTVLQQFRTPGGYRLFTLGMLPRHSDMLRQTRLVQIWRAGVRLR
jgi:hypothetical protein